MKLNLSLSFLASDSHPTWLYVRLSLPFGLRVCLFLPVYVLGHVADGSRRPHLAGILPVLLVPGTHHVLGDLARVGMITLLAGHQVDVRTLDGVRVFTCKERWAMITSQSALLIDPPSINPPPPVIPFSHWSPYSCLSLILKTHFHCLTPDWSFFPSLFPPIGLSSSITPSLSQVSRSVMSDS